MSEILELETMGSEHISVVCEKAAEKAKAAGVAVHFVFNETDVTAQPGESAQVLEARWRADYEAKAKAWRESPEYAAREAQRVEDDRRAREAHMTEGASTEAELREAKVPWPLTEAQLAEYIESLVSKTHDYGTCVYAMSMAAEAAFNYVAGKLGVTGFQASCADLDFVRRVRNLNGPFILLKGEDALYPQYDLPKKLQEAMESWKPWLAEQADKNLADKGPVHPEVVAHWRKLATSKAEVR
jgi:hypothetical protein